VIRVTCVGMGVCGFESFEMRDTRYEIRVDLWRKSTPPKIAVTSIILTLKCVQHTKRMFAVQSRMRIRINLSNFIGFCRCSVGSQNQFCVGILALRANSTFENHEIAQLLAVFSLNRFTFASKTSYVSLRSTRMRMRECRTGIVSRFQLIRF